MYSTLYLGVCILISNKEDVKNIEHIIHRYEHLDYIICKDNALIYLKRSKIRDDNFKGYTIHVDEPNMKIDTIIDIVKEYIMNIKSYSAGWHKYVVTHDDNDILQTIDTSYAYSINTNVFKNFFNKSLYSITCVYYKLKYMIQKNKSIIVN